jgi:carboxymethylenebutenolidase
MKNSWETVTVDNSLMRLYLSQPDGPGPFPTMVVVQNQDGVGAFTQEMTRRVAQAGYVGIAPELYHREGEPKTPDQVADIKRTRNDLHVISDINAAVKFLRGCATADTSRLGIIGFCMGGRIAFLMAAADPSFKAAVDFYGGGVYSKWGDRPAPSELAASVSCPIQGHFGELDKNPPPDEMRKLDAELTRLGKQHEFFFYAGAPHGFNRNGWDGYRPEADATSWARTLDFFKKHLGEMTTKKAATAR